MDNHASSSSGGGSEATTATFAGWVKAKHLNGNQVQNDNGHSETLLRIRREHSVKADNRVCMIPEGAQLTRLPLKGDWVEVRYAAPAFESVDEYVAALSKACESLNRYDESAFNKAMEPVFIRLGVSSDSVRNAVLQQAFNAGVEMRYKIGKSRHFTDSDVKARPTSKLWDRVLVKVKEKGGGRYFKAITDYGAIRVILRFGSNEKQLNDTKEAVKKKLDGCKIFEDSYLYALYHGHLVEIQVLHEFTQRIYAFNSQHRDDPTFVKLSRKTNICTENKNFQSYAKDHLYRKSRWFTWLGWFWQLTEDQLMSKLAEVAKEQGKSIAGF